MLNSKLSRSALSLILAMMLVFSLFTVGVFAEETLVSAETGETTADDGATDDGATAESDETATVDDASETEANVEEEHDHDHDHDDETTADESTEEEDKGLSTFDIVSLIILGVLVIIGVVYCLKNREKVGKFLRSLRSEFKKISWSSWKDVRKNTLVVIVVVIAVALVIAGMDFLFSRGILAMKSLLS